MAQVYHPKSTATKFLEGFVAGLLAGLLVALIMLVVDLLTPNRPWWSTVGLVGSLLSGTPEANIKNFDIVTYIIGAIIHFLIFGLMGLGFVQYVPLFKRFKIDLLLGGAIYGAIIYGAIFLYAFNVFKPGIPANMNNIALFIACVLGGVLMGYWLKRAANVKSSAAPAAPVV